MFNRGMNTNWNEWAEALAVVANKAGMDKTAADFPKTWEPDTYMEGRDNDFNAPLSDYLSDRASERMEP